jgi:hypothetical protein
MPGTKRPGEYTMKNWYGTSQSGNATATACQPKSKSTHGRSGPTLACAWPSITDLKVIDIDTDDTDLMAAVLGGSPGYGSQEEVGRRALARSIEEARQLFPHRLASERRALLISLAMVGKPSCRRPSIPTPDSPTRG